MRTITITITEEMVQFIYELHAMIRKAPKVSAEEHPSCTCLGARLGLGETKAESEKEEETSPRTPLKEEEREKEEKGRGRVSREGAKESSLLPKMERPSYDEVCEYIERRGITSFEPLEFYSYYEGRGWTIENGVPMRNWKACVVQWDIRRRTKTLGRTPLSGSPLKPAPKPKAPDNRVLFVEPVLPDTSEDISYVEYLESLKKKKGGTG